MGQPGFLRLRKSFKYGGQGRNRTALHVSDYPTPHRYPAQSSGLESNMKPRVEPSDGRPKLDAVDSPQTLERRVTKFAQRLSRLHPDEIGRDPKKFKRRVISILRRKLPPFAGRPAEESITRAAALREKGHEWREIYPMCIPNHIDLIATDRRHAESNLRAALRSRRNAARRRKHARQLVAEAKPISNVLSFQGSSNGPKLLRPS